MGANQHGSNSSFSRVVRASASEEPGLESRLRWDFSGSSRTSEGPCIFLSPSNRARHAELNTFSSVVRPHDRAAFDCMEDCRYHHQPSSTITIFYRNSVTSNDQNKSRTLSYPPPPPPSRQEKKKKETNAKTKQNKTKQNKQKTPAGVQTPV